MINKKNKTFLFIELNSLIKCFISLKNKISEFLKRNILIVALNHLVEKLIKKGKKYNYNI